MKTKYYFFSVIFLFFTLCVASCKNGIEDNLDTVNDSIAKQDSIDSANVANSTIVTEDTVIHLKKTFKNPDVQEAHKSIVKKYGVQWDFCKCIQKNDSINKALAGDLTDAETDKLLKRMDEVGVKCKDLLIQPNSTPEERAAYQRKVRNCLNKAN